MYAGPRGTNSLSGFDCNCLWDTRRQMQQTLFQQLRRDAMSTIFVEAEWDNNFNRGWGEMDSSIWHVIYVM